MRTGSAAIAPRIAARWEIDLSVGGRSSPRRRSAGRRLATSCGVAAVRRSPRSPGRRPAPPPRRRAPSGTQSAISPWLLSGDGLSAMSEMLMPARPRVSAMSAMTPGRLGTATRSSLVAPGPSPASTSARRRSAACVLPARQVGPARSCVADRLELGDGAVEGIGQRVAVGRVDAAPQRRVGAGHARGVAEARAGGRRALAAQRVRARGDEDVGHARAAGG
jgi:hypothetical protein